MHIYRTYSDEGDSLPWGVGEIAAVTVRAGVSQSGLVDGGQQLVR